MKTLYIQQKAIEVFEVVKISTFEIIEAINQATNLRLFKEKELQIMDTLSKIIIERKKGHKIATFINENSQLFKLNIEKMEIVL